MASKARGLGGRGAAPTIREGRARTTVMMPSKMRQELRMAAVSGGYGLRGKSRWIAEAVERFLALDQSHWIGLVAESDVRASLKEHEVIYLSATGKRGLDTAALILRAAEPSVEGPMSAIVRTSVTWRLLDGPLQELSVRQSN